MIHKIIHQMIPHLDRMDKRLILKIKYTKAEVLELV